MALQIWLPLIGNTTNQGVSNWEFSVSNDSYITVDNSGKIGKCYNFNSSATNKGIYADDNGFMNKCINYKSWSICAWVNVASTVSITCVIGLSYGLRIYVGSTSANTYVVLSNSERSVSCGSDVLVNDGNWHHIAVTYDSVKNTINFYVDGVSRGTKAYTSGYTYYSSWSNGLFIGRDPNKSTVSDNYLFKGRMNDVRVYNHALSQKEISDISKAKVVHYPFNDNSIQQLSNVYSYPTFNTSSASGGWNHWGGSGHIGTYGQNTDKQYIFNKYNTYSHWFANDTGATYNYMLYQSPAFEGGYRSLCCILKEQNSLPITESIVYPTWNARSGGVPHGKWTSVQPLGDGFYLCKVEGLRQDGSNDLVGLYVTAGNKVYVSEAYLENDKTVCSDIRYYNSTLYDCSGNNYHGTCNASMIMNNSSPRSKYSTTFNGTSNSIAITRPFESGTKHPEMTFAFWINRNDYTDATQRMIYNGICQLYLYTDYKLRITWTHAKADSSATNTWATGLLVPAGQWHHVCLTFKDGYLRCYYDGTQNSYSDRTNTGQFMGGAYATTQSIGYNQFGGSLSDFRIYATALSADEVKALYNVGASVDNYGNMFAYEFNEV